MRALGYLVLTTSVVMISGCANIVKAPAGASYTEVTAKYGKPTTTCAMPNDGLRAVWSQQPYGQYAWGTDVDRQGDIGPVIQVLDDEVFKQVDEGVWTPERVECTFGPPARVETIGLPGVRKNAWFYRYKQYGVWNMLMVILFDPETELVVQRMPMPDPMYQYDRWPVWF